MKVSENQLSLHIFVLSEAIVTDQLMALIVAKVIIDTDQWKVHNGNVY